MVKSLRDDNRGAAIQIGAILLFAVVLISFSTYQANIVPQQNAKVEFEHSQTIESDLVELRDSILRASGSSVEAAVGLQLGTTYPTRAVAANPPPPAGTVRTVGTASPAVAINITNATAPTASSETGEYWTGDQRNYSTGFIAYTPRYNEYRNAPTSRLDNTVFYREYRAGNQTTAGEAVVNGRDITLIVINGSVRKQSAGKESVSVTPLSVGREEIQIKSASQSEPLTITFDSTQPAETWRTSYLSEEYDPDGGSPDAYITEITGNEVGSDRYEITLTFETSTSYNLRMAKVGVGTQLTDTTAAYLASPTVETAQIQAGESTEITATVRDEYNNPVSGTTVNASVDTESEGQILGETVATSDSDGKVSFTYEAPDSQASTTDQQVNLTLGELGTHSLTGANSTEAIVTVQPTNGGGGGNNDGSVNPNGRDAECLENISSSDSTADSTIVIRMANNQSCGDVRITEFAISTPGNNSDSASKFTHVEEQESEKHEVEFSGGVREDAYAEAQNAREDNIDDNTADEDTEEANTGEEIFDFKTDGDYYGFDVEPVIESGHSASASFEFAREEKDNQNNNGNGNGNNKKDSKKINLDFTIASSSGDSDITITLHTEDGSTKQIYLKLENDIGDG